MSRKTEDDQFYIMASTNAHIGEALETASKEHHKGVQPKPLAQSFRSLAARCGGTLRKYFFFISRLGKK